MTLTPDQTPAGWDDVATEYERSIVRLTRVYAPRAVGALGIAEGERVLDVACGPGTASLIAAAEGAEVVAVDHSEGMIRLLEARIERERLQGIRPAVMDGQALDLPDGSFDAALCVFGLMFFPDQPRGFAELHRVLCPGGRAAVMTWADPERNPALSVWRSAIEDAVPGFEPPAAPLPVFSLSDPDRLLELMRGAGFADARVTSVTGSWTFDSPEGLWEELHDASPVRRSMMAVIGEHQEAVRGRLVFLLRERFGAGPIEIPGEALLAEGTKA